MDSNFTKMVKTWQVPSSSTAAGQNEPCNAVMTSACRCCIEAIKALDEEAERLTAALAVISMAGGGGGGGKRLRTEERATCQPQPSVTEASSSDPAAAGTTDTLASSAEEGGPEGIRARLERIAVDKADEEIHCCEIVHFARPTEEIVQAWLFMYPR